MAPNGAQNNMKSFFWMSLFHGIFQTSLGEFGHKSFAPLKFAYSYNYGLDLSWHKTNHVSFRNIKNPFLESQRQAAALNYKDQRTNFKVKYSLTVLWCENLDTWHHFATKLFALVFGKFPHKYPISKKQTCHNKKSKTYWRGRAVSSRSWSTSWFGKHCRSNRRATIHGNVTVLRLKVLRVFRNSRFQAVLTSNVEFRI